MECQLPPILQTGLPVTETIIHHELENRGQISVDGYQDPGSFRQKINYEVDEEQGEKQIYTLVDRAKNCHQNVRYRCRWLSSLLLTCVIVSGVLKILPFLPVITICNRNWFQTHTQLHLLFSELQSCSMGRPGSSRWVGGLVVAIRRCTIGVTRLPDLWSALARSVKRTRLVTAADFAIATPETTNLGL